MIRLPDPWGQAHDRRQSRYMTVPGAAPGQMTVVTWMAMANLEDRQWIDRRPRARLDSEWGRHEQECPARPLHRFTRDALKIEVLDQGHSHADDCQNVKRRVDPGYRRRRHV